MSVSQVHYLPLAPPFFFILVGLFLLLLVLIQLGVLRYAYMRLGVSSGAALLLLFASLIVAGNLSPGNFGLLQHNLPTPDSRTAANEIFIRSHVEAGPSVQTQSHRHPRDG